MIYGEKVRLRAIERSDLPNFVRWFNDPEVRRYLLMFIPISSAQEEKWFEDLLQRMQRRETLAFAVDARIEDEWAHIGNIGLHRIDWKNRCAYLGIALGERAYWHQGCGTDATRTILRFAFDELNLHWVELEVIDENMRARRCYEKAGFRYEGIRRKAIFLEGGYRASHLMGILQEKFQ